MSKDLQKMMRQAQQMAAEMQQVQAELADKSFEATAGGGAVTVVATGDQQITSVRISPDAFEGEPDEDDIEMLADAITAAANDALGRARDAQTEALGPLAGGLGGPGGLPGT